MLLNKMTKYFQKAKKKLGQGIKSLTKIEKKKTNELFTSEDTQRFIILHFGTGSEADFNGIQQFLGQQVNLNQNTYSLGNNTYNNIL